MNFMAITLPSGYLFQTGQILADKTLSCSELKKEQMCLTSTQKIWTQSQLQPNMFLAKSFNISKSTFSNLKMKLIVNARAQQGFGEVHDVIYTWNTWKTIKV